MANRFWVGGTGNWTDNTNHWSATSGGAPGASTPVFSDNVYFDANSFNAAGQIVTLNTPTSVADMDWTGATNTPTFAGSPLLNVYGSLTYIAAMTFSHTGAYNFRSTSTGKTITLAGKTIAGPITFDGVGGGWTLQDTLTTNSDLTLTNGTLNTNGKTVTCVNISSNNSNVRTLTLGASVINLSGDWNISTITSLTFNVNTSVINMTGNTKTFAGGGLTYNIVNFNGPTATISGSNTFATLNQAKGTTVNVTAGTTQTITNPVLNGTTASPSTLQSTVAGTPATIALPAGRYFIRHTSIKDITITGATTVTSIAGTNVSGNTGITFVTKFEMGRIKNDGSFNWYNSTTGTVTKVSG